jgi:hypothetical protein
MQTTSRFNQNSKEDIHNFFWNFLVTNHMFGGVNSKKLSKNTQTGGVHTAITRRTVEKQLLGLGAKNSGLGLG